MMSNTPRVFVGTTTFLIAGMKSRTDLQTVTTAINSFPGILVGADQLAGLVNSDRRTPGEPYGPDRRHQSGRLHRAGIARCEPGGTIITTGNDGPDKNVRALVRCRPLR